MFVKVLSLLIVCFVVIFFIVFFPRSPPQPKEQFDVGDVSTGDLIFLSGETFAEKCIRGITRSPFSHVAIVLEEMTNSSSDDVERKIFIWEADIGQGRKVGPRVIPLLDKLERWKGKGVIGVRKLYSEDVREKIRGESDRHIQKYIDKEFDNDMITWFFPPKTKGDSAEQKGVFCSQLVAQLLMDAKVLGEEKSAQWYCPGSLMKEKIEGYGDEVKYFSF